MARPLRIEYPGAWYHVMNRGLARQNVFLRPGDAQRFISLLAETSELFGIQCHAYCLMPNHYHLLLHTPRGELSRAMRHVNSLYTQHFNRSHERDGPLFRGRYKAILVDADDYLLQVSRYIHRNPIEAGLATRPESYRWSSYAHYLASDDGPDWLYRDTVLSAITGPDSAEAYREYVESGLDPETTAFYNRRRQPPVLGSPRFRERLRERRAPGRAEIPSYQRVAAVPDIDAITRAVATAYDQTTEALARDHRGRDGEARAVAMTLCRRIGGYRLTEIAEAFGGCSYAAVSKAVSRTLRRMREDGEFAHRVRTLEASLNES